MSNQVRTLRNVALSALAVVMLLCDQPHAFGTSAASGTEIVPLSMTDLSGKPISRLANSGAGDVHLKVRQGEGRAFSSVARYTSADQQLKVNVKRFEQSTLELVDWPIDEVMILINGRVEITGATGRTRIYDAGDAFVMPKGFTGRWRQLSAIEMYTVEYGVWK